MHDRPELLLAQVLDIGVAALLWREQLPGLAPFELDDQHVVGVAVTFVGLVVLLRKEHHAVGQHAGQRFVEPRDEGVDLGIENVDALEHDRRAAANRLVERLLVHELELAALHGLVKAGFFQLDALAAELDVHPFRLQQRVVQMPL